MTTKLIYLVIETLEKPWDWNLLSANPNIDQEDVINFPHFPWNWAMFSMNPNLDFEFVLAHRTYGWNWLSLSENPAINWNHVSAHLDLPWNWSVLPTNRNIRMETILSHPVFPWGNVAKSPNLRLSHVLAHASQSVGHSGWDWFSITVNRNAWTSADLLAHPDLPWHWPLISNDVQLTPELLTRLRDKWNYESLSRNPSVTLDMIEAFPDHPWNWMRVSQNPNLTLDYVLQHPERPWDLDLLHYSLPLGGQVRRFRTVVPSVDWAKLSYNPSITVHDILENIDAPWHSRGISTFMNLTIQDIRQLQARLDWNTLSSNPNIRVETVANTVHLPWNWAELSCNRFG